MAAAPDPVFFREGAKFGAWLAQNSGKHDELIVGFWKVGTGKPSMTWAESVEQALAHGWIDGVRRSLGPESYTIRFTPRKASSNWSLVNVKTARRLIAEGRMAEAGRKAFAARRVDRTGVYSAEQRRHPQLTPAEATALKADAKAWADFTRRPPSYRKAATWWIVSAKKPETRARRLALLIASSRAGKRVPPLTPRPGKK